MKHPESVPLLRRQDASQALGGQLEVQGLNIGYRRSDGKIVAAVHNVGFTVAAGASLGIVGESGSGKSTVARALLGHCRPGGVITGGAVRIAGEDILGLDEAGRRRLRGRHIAFVPQNPLSSLTPHMRIGDQVDEAVRHLRGCDAAEARARTLELFAATNLPDPQAICARYPHELSGGQRQRVVIAAALAGDPGLLVLDEPTTALDKTTEVQVLELVRTLRHRFNTSLIYVSHDLGVISRMCDEVIVMYQGAVVEQGPAAKIFSAPAHAYTQQLIAAIPRVDAEPPPRAHVDAAAMAAPLLSAEELAFSYPARRRNWFQRSGNAQRPALARLSFSIARGETLGLVGESGSGKSTAASLVAGLMAPSGGALKFDGQALAPLATGRSLALRRRIQIVFQDPLSSLNPRQRIATILERPLTMFTPLRGPALRERAQALMRDMHLDPALLECYPRQLSGGQQQRVAIARAFAAEPDLIICDEITSALDVSVQAQVLDLLLELQRKTGTAYLFISHDLGVIRRMADRVMVLQQGAVCEAGPTEQVFKSPHSAYTRLLLQATALHSVNAHPENVSS
ncbi:ABC transporter ATP-binding protein [Acidovorax sp. Be4]|uniref:ABC transporter ATP-binding protein n=1 Tax=Acidovorax bellezanensis TaxID=2976702 RepID=A0ABT2PSJ6_9BURK|nr:ABC transporter ATP-binding protein [Acidovorax sp. Be4]MCT9813448.1 ABC transporter ATP-binding protein [Acidovorax sp. Be4]